jgi:hypothetical protein
MHVCVKGLTSPGTQVSRCSSLYFLLLVCKSNSPHGLPEFLSVSEKVQAVETVSCEIKIPGLANFTSVSTLSEAQECNYVQCSEKKILAD